MKRSFKLWCGIFCLILAMVCVLSACDWNGPVNVPQTKDQTPAYYGMLMSISPNVEIPEVTYSEDSIVNNGNHNGHGNTNNNGNHYGWYKDDNGDGKLDTDFLKQLCYVSQNQDVYFYVGISNPAKYDITSFVINGKTYTSDMFEARSTNEVKIVKGNIGDAHGIVEYTISDIKYVEGSETKDVLVMGNRTAKAGVRTENQVTATVTKLELKNKKAQFEITLSDNDGLIAYSDGSAKIVLYKDGAVVDEKKLSVGSNSVKFNNLKENNTYHYAVVASYDDLSGIGVAIHELIGKQALQASHSHTFGEWKETKAPTCGEDGVKTRTCSSCGESETGKIPATGMHVYDNACDVNCNVCGHIREVPEHVYDNACDVNCNVCGYTRVVPEHVYDNACDANCNVCGDIREVPGHVYDNACDVNCNVCGDTRVVPGHVYDNACDVNCNVCGDTRVVPGHVYDNACDADCNVCGDIRVVSGHVYDDQYDDTCNECGFVRDADCKHVYDNDCDTICNACGEIRTVDPSVHVYDNACDWNCNVCGYPRAVGDHVYDDQYDATCNECGFVRDADCKHVYDNDCDTICNACGEIRTVDPSVHVYDNACDWNCNVCGYPRAVGDHVYDNTCDTTCNVCGATRTAGGHNYISTVTPPTATENGAITYTCSNCGNTYSETIVPQDFTVTAQNRAMVGYTGAENENLVIPAVFEDNGTWYRVTSIGNHAFLYSTNLISVTIPDSVTTIGEFAFANCTGITSLTIGNSVTTIGMYAFSSCSFTNITLPDSVITIGEGVFEYCTSLTCVAFGNSVTAIGEYLFECCTNLTHVVFGNSVISINEGAFYGCNAFIAVYYIGTAEDWNGITIANQYGGNSNILNATCYYYSETQPTTEGNYWHYVDGVPTVWEVEIHTHSYTSTVTAEPTATTNGVITYTCSCTDSYTEELIPQDFTVTADNRAMVGYTGAENENLVIPAVFEDNGTWYRVTAIGNMAFYYCDRLANVTIPNSVTIIDDRGFQHCSNLMSVTIPDFVTIIGNFAFRDCNKLTIITIPDAVTTIGYHAFFGCTNLTSVTIGNSVTTIGTDAFGSCHNLASIIIPNSVTTIAPYAFHSCYNLVNVVIPDSVTTIGDLAFHTCINLTNVTIPDSVTTIGNLAFYSCYNLESVTIGNSVTSIGESAFASCDNLVSIIVGENNIAYKSIDGNLYSKDGKVLVAYSIGKKDTTFVIPNFVTTIGESAFFGCDAFTSVTIGNSITIIGDDAFACCDLTSITIPESVTIIGEDAFSSCYGLTSITFEGTVEEWSFITLGVTWNYNVPATYVQCSDGIVSLS